MCPCWIKVLIYFKIKSYWRQTFEQYHGYEHKFTWPLYLLLIIKNTLQFIFGQLTQ